MASPKTIQISGEGGGATLDCDNCVYPFLGRSVDREVIEHVYRDGDTDTPGQGAVHELEVLPYTVVGQTATFSIPFADAATEALLYGYATSASAEMQTIDPDFGTRVWKIEKYQALPRTDLDAFFNVQMGLKRVS